MKFPLVFVAVALAVFQLCECHDMIVGSSYNSELIWHEKVEYNALPWRKRVKTAFYPGPTGRIIKGVIARDLDHTTGGASITAGGVGMTYVNVRFKSQRGHSINYQLEIYA